ncbi:hypothetical protein DHD05_04675 [Arenibacter sp. N53]|nr:hypothetical protein [Arenibacter sp. N53]
MLFIISNYYSFELSTGILNIYFNKNKGFMGIIKSQNLRDVNTTKQLRLFNILNEKSLWH